MIRCKEVTYIIATDGLEGAGLAKRIAVRLHLMMCKYCRRYESQLRAIRKAARRILSKGTRAEDPETLERLEETILEKTRQDPGNPS